MTPDCLATIEAIYYFMKELFCHTCNEEYDGRYDDLLWMYLWTYNLIQKKYVAEGKTFFHIENYIKRPSETSGSADGEGAEDEDNSDSASKTSGGGVDTAEEDK